ncbi:AtpZ/AtpI family protein [Novosphingobium lentum]|uniref:AtpZ/AtpI family protein n=1 Tax=Novosphingobium lentum TaxID=145287 RepID=UPI000833518F|nr:AtpZ/AtpI family protein [Novosphingobium lentum]
MVDEPSGQDPLGEDARIVSLDGRLDAARQREAERTRSPQQGQDAGYDSANKVLAELLGGIIGGVAIGLVIDWLIGKGTHWGLLVMMFLGIIVAFRNIFRISNRRSD